MRRKPPALLVLGWFVAWLLLGIGHAIGWATPRPWGAIRGLHNGQEVVCTTFAIRDTHLWLTAAHCLHDIDKPVFTIDKQPVVVVVEHQSWDVALLQGGPKTPVLRLQGYRPLYGQPVVIGGYPLALTPSFAALAGTVAAPEVVLPDGRRRIMFAAPVILGNSGSPALNADYAVVSLVLQGLGRPSSIISLGPRWEDLKTFLASYPPKRK